MRRENETMGKVNTTARTARARMRHKVGEVSLEGTKGTALAIGSALTSGIAAPVTPALAAAALYHFGKGLYRAGQAANASVAAEHLRPAENAKALQHFKNMQNKLQAARQGIGPKTAPAKPAVGAGKEGWNNPANKAAIIANRMARKGMPK